MISLYVLLLSLTGCKEMKGCLFLIESLKGTACFPSLGSLPLWHCVFWLWRALKLGL